MDIVSGIEERNTSNRMSNRSGKIGCEMEGNMKKEAKNERRKKHVERKCNYFDPQSK